MNMKDEVRQGSGNVFADLELPDAEELNAKAQVAYRIRQILEEQRLTEKQAAAVLGIDQSRISTLLRGRLDGFSSDRLFRLLDGLARAIGVVIKPVGRACRQQEPARDVREFEQIFGGGRTGEPDDKAIEPALSRQNAFRKHAK